MLSHQVRRGNIMKNFITWLRKNHFIGRNESISITAIGVLMESGEYIQFRTVAQIKEFLKLFNSDRSNIYWATLEGYVNHSGAISFKKLPIIRNNTMFRETYEY